MEEGVGRERGRGRGGGRFGVVAAYSLFDSGCDNETAGAGTGIDGSGLAYDQTMLKGVPLLRISLRLCPAWDVLALDFLRDGG
jgi:hypothetical protein